MTAVPPRPAAPDLPYPLGRHCCGAPNPSVCHQRGLCWMEGVHPDSPGYRPAAPDVTAGDELREECCDRVYVCNGEVECPAHGGFDVCCDRPDLHRPVAARGAGGLAVCAWHAGDARRRYGNCAQCAALPALRDVLAAATRDAKAVKRVRELVAFYDRHEYSSLEVDDLRRALDGPAEPPQDAPGGAGARMDGSDVAGAPGANGGDSEALAEES